MAGMAWYDRPRSGLLHITFLDTPGDAILIQTPTGKYLLVDGGEAPAELALALGNHLPFWQRTIELAILTHNDDSRLLGQIAALQRYQASYALAPSVSVPTPNMQQWLHILTTQHTPIIRAQHGNQIPFDNMRLTILTTAADSNTNTTLYLSYGTTRFLFLLHCARESELLALQKDIPAPITVLAYPWACPMSSPLLNYYQPEAIVFTTGAEQDEPVLLSYAERRWLGMSPEGTLPRIYHQKLDGTITFVSDGQRIAAP
jgi:beta-lactamase superfamily II metal-dependent hydrolase